MLGKLGGGGGFSHLGALLGGVKGSGPPPPDAPVLSENSESAGLVSLLWDIDATVAAGDTLIRQAQVSGGNWTSLVDNTSHVITSGEDSAGSITASLQLNNGTYDIRGFVKSGTTGKTSAASNVLTITISDATVSGRLMWGTSQQLWSSPNHMIWN
jgi:hypothetical protein